MAIVMINLGSNRGDRRLHLSRGVTAVAREFGPFEVSHAVESRPWGYESENKFLNIGMMFRSELEPEEIMDRLQRIEASVNTTPHRNSDGSYSDRELDIDIVAIDDLQLSGSRLTVPHPHLEERRFFLEPLAETAPGWRHPATGLTAKEMLAALNAKKEDCE